MLNPTLKAQLGLNEDQIREFKDAFDIFDEDASGTVSTGELASVMRTLGQDIDEKEVGIMISEVDSDGSGEIDFAEFCTLMSRQMEKADPEFEYKKAFKIFDKRGDGFIDNAELKHVMTNIGEDMSDHEILAMIKEADLDGDGMLNYDEFLNIMLAK
ncbi:uncharacterized protein LOC134819253 [Bolinopsis microptera]|uniref:uncharacterized protein LOC134819253 n=1 Tax=Bolinopsis microptera TaxID=2820187 RepID=UPI0030790EF7